MEDPRSAESMRDNEQIRAAALERAIRFLDAAALRLSEPPSLPYPRPPNRKERRAMKAGRGHK